MKVNLSKNAINYLQRLIDFGEEEQVELMDLKKQEKAFDELSEKIGVKFNI